jgi:hypothetical protein
LTGQSSAIVQITLTEAVKEFEDGDAVVFEARLSLTDSWTTIHEFSDGETATAAVFNGNNYDLAAELGTLTDTTEIRFMATSGGVTNGEAKIKLDALTINGTLPAVPGTKTNLVTSRTLVGDEVSFIVTMTLSTAGTATNVVADPSLSVADPLAGDPRNGFTATCGGPTLTSADSDISGPGDPVTYEYECTSDTSGLTASALPAQLTLVGGATADDATFNDGRSNGVLAAPPLTYQVQIDSGTTLASIDNTAQIQSFEGTPVIPLTNSNEVNTLLNNSIGDTVFIDLDGDGFGPNHPTSADTDEPGLAGVIVYLCAGNVSVCDAGTAGVQTTTTDINGNYYFADLADGDWTVAIDMGDTALDGFSPTTTTLYSYTLNNGDNETEADFGVRTVTTVSGDAAALGDLVWLDEDEDGVQDAGEPGIAGVTVNLYDDEGNLLDSTTTSDGTTDVDGDGVLDPEGSYYFGSLFPDNYVVEVVPPAGMEPLAPTKGTTECWTGLTSTATVSGTRAKVSAGITPMLTAPTFSTTSAQAVTTSRSTPALFRTG